MADETINARGAAGYLLKMRMRRPEDFFPSTR